MKRSLLRRMFWGAFVGVVLVVPGAARQADPMDQIVREFTAENRFMGAVLVSRDGTSIFNRAYGFANLEWQVANTTDTRFRIGSLSKQFTAAAVLLLEERGALRTDDPIRKHLPEAPDTWQAITIHHVLTHTSGIPNFTAFPDYQSTKTLPSRPDQTLGRFRDKPLDFPPGSKFSYSNSGYILLAALVERLSGERYEAFLQTNIFDRVGLKDTGSDAFVTILPRRATGYAPSTSATGGLLQHAGYIDMTIPIGGGSLYSTTEDLARWTAALFGGKLLKADSLEKMTRPALSGYAYGLGVVTLNGRRSITHSGGIEGFNSVLTHFPQANITVAVLANVNGMAPTFIAGRLARAAHGDSPADR